MKKEDLTMYYSLDKDEENNTDYNTEIDSKNENRPKIFKKIFGFLGKKKSNDDYIHPYEEESDHLVSEIAEEQKLTTIKKTIGTDQIFDEICQMPFKLFKSNLSVLNSITNDDQFYIIKKLNEDLAHFEEQDIIDKTIYVIGINKNILIYHEKIILKIIKMKVLEKLLEVEKLPKISYKINKIIPFSNKRALLFLEHGLLNSDSDVDLTLYSINKMKKIAEEYGEDYIRPFLHSKFKSSKFISFNDIKELLNIGLDINTTDDLGRNALWYIKECDDLIFLLDKGIKLNKLDDKNENFLFHYISNLTSFNFIEKELIEKTIDLKINVNNINIKGENILFTAARKNTNCLHYLLNLNIINCHQLNNKGENILFFIDDRKTIDVLVNSVGFNINIVNNYGENLLFNRSFETVAMLIEMGVYKKNKDFSGKTYLDRD